MDSLEVSSVFLKFSWRHADVTDGLLPVHDRLFLI